MSFDSHAEKYRDTLNDTLRPCGVEADQLAGYKAKIIHALLTRQFGDPRSLKVLDVGCGIGLVDRDLVCKVGELHGTDVSQNSLTQAAAFVPAAHFRQFNGEQVPYSDGAFDLVFASCVLHHVSPNDRLALVEEMTRVTRPGGIVLVLEHNPRNPVTRYIVSHCPFDEDAVLLGRAETVNLLKRSGMLIGASRYIAFWPKRSDFIDRLEEKVGWLPVGAQYYVWARKSEKHFLAS